MCRDGEECQELWRKYDLATTVHVELDSNRRLAAIQKNVDLIESLTREAKGAEKNHAELSQLIREHEASHLASRRSRKQSSLTRR